MGCNLVCVVCCLVVGDCCLVVVWCLMFAGCRLPSAVCSAFVLLFACCLPFVLRWLSIGACCL